jgi:hypothetical protein
VQNVSLRTWLIIAFAAALLAGAVAVSHVGHPNLEKYVAIAGVLVNFFGFLLVFRQLQAASHAAENQTRWEVEQVSFSVYNLLIERIELRPFFYDNVEPPAEGSERWRIDTACELLLDYFETIVSSSPAHDDASEEVWCVYMQQMYARSPALRTFVERECSRYRLDLISLLDAGLGERESRRRRTHLAR